MKIKAVVTDIDGTITDGNQLIDTEVIRAFRRLESRGVRVCIASGNVLPVAYAVANYAGISGPVIAENGGVVSWGKDVYQLFEADKPQAALKKLAGQMPVKRLFSDQWRLSAVSLVPETNAEKVRTVLKNEDVMIEETGFAVHILNKGQNKSAGLKKAAGLLNLDMDDFAAFGDSDNDKEMLSACGFSTAVANASAAAKEASAYTSKKEYGAGVLDGLAVSGLL